MDAALIINGGPNAKTAYIGWTPVDAGLSLGPPLPAGDVAVTLRNAAGTVGQVQFAPAGTVTFGPTLQLTLAASGASRTFALAGTFDSPSTADGDAGIEVVEDATGTVLTTVRLMVRVRKDANKLTDAERDRFLHALLTLNSQGKYKAFPEIHVQLGQGQAHGHSAFLPWHRAFLLDLERELQAVDASVALPYWRFDRRAAKVFRDTFMGRPKSATLNDLVFTPTNPLTLWTTPVGIPGLNRRPFFDPAQSPPWGLNSERSVVQPNDPTQLYTAFRPFLEGNPHGSAHTSFTGDIDAIPTAARDPLFFMLHANVDRLWAIWQVLKQRFDVAQLATYDPSGSAPAGSSSIGRFANDEMWPWNGVIGFPRPNFAPGGPMPGSPIATAPGPKPRVRDLVDYQGRLSPGARLGFDYDDVPFVV